MPSKTGTSDNPNITHEGMSEQILDAIGSISDGFALYDTHDCLIFCNDRYREIYPTIADMIKPGVKFEDLIRAGYQAAENHDSGEDNEAMIEQHLTRFREADGSHEQHRQSSQWLLCSDRRTTNGNTACIRTDITKQKLAEDARRDAHTHLEQRVADRTQQLEESEVRLYEAQVLASIGHWVWDARTKTYASASEEVARIHGVSVSNFIESKPGEPDRRFVHPDDLDRLDAKITEAVNHGTGYQVDYRIVRPDGVIRHVRETNGGLVNDSGDTIFSTGAIQDITDQKQAEEAVQTSEQRFQTLFHQSPIGISVEDYSEVKRLIDRLRGEGVDDFLAYFRDNGDSFAEAVENIRMVSANDTLIQMFGTTSLDEYMKFEQDYTVLENDDWRAYYINEFATFASGGVTFSGEVSDFLADGTSIGIRCVSRVIESAMEDWSEVISTHEDITERKQKEVELLKEAQQLARIGNWRWSIETDSLISCSDEFAAIHGVSMDEIHDYLPAQAEKAIHSDDKDRVAAEFKQVDEEGVDYQIEYRFVRPDGEIRHVVEIGKAVYDELGRIVEHTGTTQDITEQKRTEKVLQETLGWLEEAQRVGQVGHWVWDEIGDRHVFVSQEHGRIFGNEGKPSEHTWEEFLEMVHPDDRERIDREQDEALEARTGYESEYRIVLPNGEMRYIIERGEPMYDDAGRLIQTVGTVQNITERKLAENALREAHDNLEHRIEMRTSELSLALEDRRVAQEEAEQASHTKSEFLAHMSHELRTPLNAITGFAQMMANESFGEHGHSKYLEYAQDILGSGQLLLSVINDILDLSKIEAGEVSVTPTRFLFHPVVKECISLVTANSSSNSERVRFESSNQATDLYADERSFRQVLLNLLSNANKFTPDDGHITVTSELLEDDRVVIKIADTGIGIATKDLPKALEPFGQARSNMDISHEGTGLGLPLSQKIMELHGGTLELQSEIGVGTTVVITFPYQATEIK